MRFGNMRCARASMNPLGWHFNWFRCFCIRFLASSFLYSYWESKEGFKSAQRLWNTVEEQQVSTEIVFALSNVFDLGYLFCFLFVTHGRGLREQYYDLSLFFCSPSLLIAYFFRQKSLPRAKSKVQIVKLLSRNCDVIFVTGNQRLEVGIKEFQTNYSTRI